MNELCFFLIYLSELLILSLYCYKIFDRKLSTTKITLLFISIYSILYAISFLKNPYINLFCFILGNFLCLYFSFTGKLLNKLFHLFIITVAMLTSEVFTLSIFSNIANSLFFNTKINGTALLLASVLSKLLYFFITYAITYFFNDKKKHGNPQTGESCVLSLVPILSIGILVTCFTVTIIYPSLPSFLALMLLFSSFFILLINLTIFGLYEYIGKKNESFTSLQLQLQKEADNAEYYKMLIEQDENQKILIHDIKKHLQAISILNSSNEHDKIDSYLKHVLNSSSLQSSVRICNHEFLNSILSFYKREADKCNISIHFDIRNHSIDFLSEESITTLFCNLLDNAIEAAKNTSNAFIELSTTVKEKTPYVAITIQNSCRTNPFMPGTKFLKTTKSDKRNHGFGLKSIQKIVNSYDGKMNFFFDDETSTFHTIILLLNNNKSYQN